MFVKYLFDFNSLLNIVGEVILKQSYCKYQIAEPPLTFHLRFCRVFHTITLLKISNWNFAGPQSAKNNLISVDNTSVIRRKDDSQNGGYKTKHIKFSEEKNFLFP